MEVFIVLRKILPTVQDPQESPALVNGQAGSRGLIVASFTILDRTLCLH